MFYKHRLVDKAAVIQLRQFVLVINNVTLPRWGGCVCVWGGGCFAAIILLLNIAGPTYIAV
jgi:hypothetical protein